MNQRLKYALNFIKYRLFAKHRKGHGIHSPFLFELIIKVLNDKKADEDLKKVFEVYKKYKKSNEILVYNEIGAGTSYTRPKRLSVGEIIKKSSVNKKYGSLLFRLIKYFNCKDLLELGTSVGISTAFIARAITKSNFVSIEGVAEKVNIAKKITSELNLNTNFIVGNINDKLEAALNDFEKLDFVYFDGNHTKESTLKYFHFCLNKSHNDSVFVFDDIRWSKGMEEAWTEIKNNKNVRLSVDLYRMGLIFFREELSKEHYIIKF